MGKVNIQYIDKRAANAKVATQANDTPVDFESIDDTDVSFEVLNDTNATSKDTATPPDAATHALITSVVSSHYIRIGTAPTPATGGHVCMVGSSRLIAVMGGDASSVLKICTVS